MIKDVPIELNRKAHKGDTLYYPRDLFVVKVKALKHMLEKRPFDALTSFTNIKFNGHSISFSFSPQLQTMHDLMINEHIIRNKAPL